MPVISTNTAANSALRYLNLNADEQSSSLSKIASGSRINKASDDAAGLAVGTSLQSDVTALEQAATNASQASSILQTADGGMARIADILQRMKALATNSDSGSVTDTERAYLDSEYQELLEEIDGIATGTRFNGESLLDGTSDFVTGTGVVFMVGSDSSDTITVEINDVSADNIIDGGTTTFANITSQTDAQTELASLDLAITSISQARANIGATMSRFDFRAENIETSIENLSAAKSAIMDVDLAEEQTKLASAEVKTQAAVAALAQANQMPQQLLDLLR